MLCYSGDRAVAAIAWRGIRQKRRLQRRPRAPMRRGTCLFPASGARGGGRRFSRLSRALPPPAAAVSGFASPPCGEGGVLPSATVCGAERGQSVVGAARPPPPRAGSRGLSRAASGRHFDAEFYHRLEAGGATSSPPSAVEKSREEARRRKWRRPRQLGRPGSAEDTGEEDPPPFFPTRPPSASRVAPSLVSAVERDGPGWEMGAARPGEGEVEVERSRGGGKAAAAAQGLFAPRNLLWCEAGPLPLPSPRAVTKQPPPHASGETTIG